MSSSALAALFIYVVSLALPSIDGADDPLSYNCGALDTFPSKGTYDTNLRSLISDLSKNVPKSGFASSIKGQRKDVAYGHGLCRGDVTQKTCEKCVADAANATQTLCGHNKTAIVWYDDCLLKYSGQNFFGKIDLQNKFALLNTNTLTDSIEFVETVDKFLNNVTATAVSRSQLYAANKLNLCKYLDLYALAQCTRDLSREQCKQCLDFARGAMAYVSANKQGGRVIFASCSMRYEIYPIAANQS